MIYFVDGPSYICIYRESPVPSKYRTTHLPAKSTCYLYHIVLEISYGDLLELLQEFNLLKARPCITYQLTSSH